MVTTMLTIYPLTAKVFVPVTSTWRLQFLAVGILTFLSSFLADFLSDMMTMMLTMMLMPLSLKGVLKLSHIPRARSLKTFPCHGCCMVMVIMKMMTMPT